MPRFALAAVLVAVLAGCANQDDIRRACAHHGGVSAVNGNGFRKFVACRDGAYKTLRW